MAQTTPIEGQETSIVSREYVPYLSPAFLPTGEIKNLDGTFLSAEKLFDAKTYENITTLNSFELAHLRLFVDALSTKPNARFEKEDVTELFSQGHQDELKVLISKSRPWMSEEEVGQLVDQLLHDAQNNQKRFSFLWNESKPADADVASTLFAVWEGLEILLHENNSSLQAGPNGTNSLPETYAQMTYMLAQARLLGPSDGSDKVDRLEALVEKLPQNDNTQPTLVEFYAQGTKGQLCQFRVYVPADSKISENTFVAILGHGYCENLVGREEEAIQLAKAGNIAITMTHVGFTGSSSMPMENGKLGVGGNADSVTDFISPLINGLMQAQGIISEVDSKRDAQMKSDQKLKLVFSAHSASNFMFDALFAMSYLEGQHKDDFAGFVDTVRKEKTKLLQKRFGPRADAEIERINTDLDGFSKLHDEGLLDDFNSFMGQFEFSKMHRLAAMRKLSPQLEMLFKNYIAGTGLMPANAAFGAVLGNQIGMIANNNNVEYNGIETEKTQVLAGMGPKIVRAVVTSMYKPELDPLGVFENSALYLKEKQVQETWLISGMDLIVSPLGELQDALAHQKLGIKTKVVYYTNQDSETPDENLSPDEIQTRKKKQIQLLKELKDAGAIVEIYDAKAGHMIQWDQLEKSLEEMSPN